MSANIRSLSGAALMLIIIPIIVGLLACMPVPVGNPERSRIDENLSGAWLLDDDGDLVMYQFLPWDKRSWLIAGVELNASDEFEGELPDIETPADYAAALEDLPIGEGGITSRSAALYKAWLAKIGGEKFMSWEMVGASTKDGRTPPDYFLVFKVDRISSDEYKLSMLNGEFDGFDDIPGRNEYEGDDYVTDYRRAFERVIKRNIDNEDLISDEASFSLHRLPVSATENAMKLFEEVIEFE